MVSDVMLETCTTWSNISSAASAC